MMAQDQGHQDDVQSALIAGCGYLGQRVAAAWRQAGIAVSAITRSPDRADVFRGRNLQPVVWDLSDATGPADLPQTDVVLWAVGFDRSAGVPREEIWLDGLRRLITRLPGSPQRFLYVSSTSVYGQGNGETVDELSATIPSTEGGRCCLQAEQLARQELAVRCPKTQLVVLRMAGIYGPNRLLRRVHDLVDRTPLPGDPDHGLNLIHVADAVRMIQYVATAADVPEVINVVNTGTVTRRQYYSRLAELVSAPAPVFGDPGSSAGRTRGGNKRVTSVSDCAAAAQFRFNDVLAGLEDAVSQSDLPPPAGDTSPAGPDA